jgi:hypothetical protein
MIERRVAQLEADRAADAVAPVPPAAAGSAPMLVAAREAVLLNSRHAVPAREPRLDRPNGDSWIV